LQPDRMPGEGAARVEESVLESRRVMILDELKSLKQRMDELYRESFEGNEEALPEEQGEAASWQPQMDVFETADEWVVMADLPGVLDEDLKVEVLENRLRISGQREFLPLANDLQLSQRERPAGTFSRTFVLPHGVREDGVSATLKLGVLTVAISKRQRSSASKIVVQRS
jgi:HSP20 family protein